MINYNVCPSVYHSTFENVSLTNVLQLPESDENEHMLSTNCSQQLDSLLVKL
jgi:hypothetical protein